MKVFAGWTGYGLAAVVCGIAAWQVVVHLLNLVSDQGALNQGPLGSAFFGGPIVVGSLVVAVWFRQKIATKSGIDLIVCAGKITLVNVLLFALQIFVLGMTCSSPTHAYPPLAIITWSAYAAFVSVLVAILLFPLLIVVGVAAQLVMREASRMIPMKVSTE